MTKTETLIYQLDAANSSNRTLLEDIARLRAENENLKDLLSELALEATHYLQNGIGAEFLQKAINFANAALARKGE